MNIEEIRTFALSLHPEVMNKEHWSDLFVERLDDGLIKQLITQSYENIIAKLPKKYRASLALTR